MGDVDSLVWVCVASVGFWTAVSTSVSQNSKKWAVGSDRAVLTGGNQREFLEICTASLLRTPQI
jgi:hypothetical protein